MHTRQVLRHFLGLEQFHSLLAALAERSRSVPEPRLGTFGVALAILISALPALAFYVTPYVHGVDMSTVLVGASACFAMVYRTSNGIPFLSVREWAKSLRLTHIGFAIGCVPALALLAFYPDAFHRLALPRTQNGMEYIARTPAELVGFIFGVAAWAALTEEVIFRGMLISVIRRWNALPSQKWRDGTAIVVSALVFGLAHLATWGPLLGFAVMGLGVGFGIAYVAIGELLLPLVVYHLIFDALSLAFAVYYQHQ